MEDTTPTVKGDGSSVDGISVSVHALSVSGISVREHSFSVNGNSVRGRVMARSLLAVTPSENLHSLSVNGNSVRGHCN